jgi:hypothetical protein
MMHNAGCTQMHVNQQPLELTPQQLVSGIHTSCRQSSAAEQEARQEEIQACALPTLIGLLAT